jgi:hypothetical protein
VRTVLANMRLALAALLLAACTTSDNAPQPDAGELADVAPSPSCADMEAMLSPHAGTCEIPWQPDLPASCTADSTGARATCTDLRVDVGGAIGVWFPSGLRPCRFVACLTSPS